MWWIPALVSTAATVAKSVWGRPKRPDQSETQKVLGTLAGQGLYSPEDIRKTTGAVSKEHADIEQKQDAQLRGYLEKAGLGGSIAGAKALSDIQTPRKEAVAETRTKMEMKNTEVKRRATIDYANLVDTLNRQKRVEDAQFKSDLIGSVANIGSSAFGGYMQSRELALKGREVAAEEGYRGSMAGYYGAMTERMDTKPLEDMTEMEFLQWAGEAKNANIVAKLLTQMGR